VGNKGLPAGGPQFHEHDGLVADRVLKLLRRNTGDSD